MPNKLVPVDVLAPPLEPTGSLRGYEPFLL